MQSACAWRSYRRGWSTTTTTTTTAFQTAIVSGDAVPGACTVSSERYARERPAGTERMMLIDNDATPSASATARSLRLLLLLLPLLLGH